MIIKKEENYTLISGDKSNFSFSEFISEFEKKHTELQKDSIFIDFSDNNTINTEDFFVFLRYAEVHKQNGTTFVIINKSLDIDKFPESFNIAPTLTEANDILEMENIQRELGF